MKTIILILTIGLFAGCKASHSPKSEVTTVKEKKKHGKVVRRTTTTTVNY